MSHESIYRYVWTDKRKGGELWRCQRGRLRRGRRYRTYGNRGQIVGRVGIEHRPAAANARHRRGNYEIDTVFGRRRKAALLTIVDQRSRFTLVEKIPSSQAAGIATALVSGLTRTGHRVHGITSDNGKEFAHQRQVAKALIAKFFFAKPYASCERGTNSNTNGLLR